MRSLRLSPIASHDQALATFSYYRGARASDSIEYVLALKRAR